ncbi:DUF4174 domain-containing protein (plasmid) [Sphingomonas paeninsulae]|uniref:DUF4174 domain-containing protein n=1 Tax=Sphingomonas paeninsulae TaxID=2319844 RepID=A0A494TD32_SPHPE|nr:DUF4174 domain-containing protein [Sphingomonas paeninsulae]AYJ84983.1 DUF4174 domain-containing protein [Sphingomonas paeninsulae]
MRTATPIIVALGLISTVAAAAPTIEQMRRNRRVLIVTALAASDARVIEQQDVLIGWKHEAEDRDVTVVEVIGDQVHGASGNVSMLRRTRHLPINSFAVILIGKDGHEAIRSSKPLTGEMLSERIDVMPMRRAGQR